VGLVKLQLRISYVFALVLTFGILTITLLCLGQPNVVEINEPFGGTLCFHLHGGRLTV
jgi:hypothetical protein